MSVSAGTGGGRGWLLLALALTGGLAWLGLERPDFGTANIALLLLLPVVIAASASGRRAGLAVALLAGIAFNFVSLEPRLTLHVAKPGDLVTLGVYALVAFVTASVAARLVEAGARARAEVAASAAFSHHAQRLLSSSDAKQVCAATAEAISGCTGLPATVVEQAGQLAFADPADEPAARWALAHRDAAGSGAKVMPGARAFYVASRAGHRALLARLDGAAPPPATQDMVRGFLDDAADTLDRIELAARLEADTREAEATAMREALFASIGHDVRTPLASLRAGLEALDGPSARLDPVRADALRLQRTFENLLELARLQATKAAPVPVSIDLTDTVASALDALPAPTRDRIEVQIAADTPLVSSDAVMLHHIVVNLIENAAKYSPANSPIQLSLQPDGAGGARLALADRGPGVGADVSDLFTLFRRGRHADSAPGSGVGLSVVDAFARALGHEVTARDRTDGPGAIFVLALAAGDPA